MMPIFELFASVLRSPSPRALSRKILTDKHPPLGLLEFREAADGADVDKTREIFAGAFGESWDAVESDYLANYDDSTPFGGLVCDAPRIDWVSPLRWKHRSTNGCEGERSIGPFDLLPARTEPEPWLEDAVALRITLPGPYRVETTGLSGTDVVSLRGYSSTYAVALRPEEPVSEYRWLDAGWVRVKPSASLDETPDVQVRLVRYPELLDGG